MKKDEHGHDAEFNITLISTADASGSLRDFINILSVPRVLSGEDWYVSVTSVFLHNEYISHTPAVAYQVLLDIINPFPGVAPIACVVPTDGSNKKPLYYAPREREEYPVLIGTLTEVRVRIQPIDAKGQPITSFYFEEGQGTVVELSFENKMFRGDVKRVFRVQSRGGPNKEYDETNTCSSFSTITNTAFTMTDNASQYSLALRSISFNPQFDYTENNTVEVIRGRETSSKIIKRYKSLYRLGRTPTHEEIAAELNRLCAGVTLNSEEGASPLMAHVTDDRVHIASSKKLVLGLPKWLLYDLGMRNFSANKNVVQTFITRLQQTYALIVFDEGRVVTFDEAPQMYAFGPDIGFIYCDGVKPTQVGGVFSPLLATFPIPKVKHPRHRQFTVVDPVYIPVSKLDLSTLSFTIRDISGRLLPFADDTNNVVALTLTLRRVYI